MPVSGVPESSRVPVDWVGTDRERFTYKGKRLFLSGLRPNFELGLGKGYSRALASHRQRCLS